MRSAREKTPGSDAADIVPLAAKLMSAIDTPAFHDALDALTRAYAGFDLTAVLAYYNDRNALLLHDGMKPVSSPAVWSTYLAGGYLLDAVYTACRAQQLGGLYRLSDLAPDAFFEADYYNSWIVHPCISMESGSLAEEIVFLVPLAPGLRVCYSLMRSNGWPQFSQEDMTRLRSIEPIVSAAIAKHCQALARPAAGIAETTGAGLEATFQTFAGGRLSPREQMIVSLILRGHSSASIANRLVIAEGTVKNHRKNIYAKLAISSQTELFAMFVKHVIEPARMAIAG